MVIISIDWRFQDLYSNRKLHHVTFSVVVETYYFLFTPKMK